MKTTCFILALAVAILAGTPAFAQTDSTASITYKEGVDLYNQGRLQEAVAKFEETIAFNPRHKNALYNLAVIHLGAGDTEKGINYLQTGVKLRDREAAGMLKKLNQKIAYADTMHLEDVDIAPKVVIKTNLEDLFSGGSIHPSLVKQITNGMKKSSVIRRDAGSGKGYALMMYIDKEGKLNAEIIKDEKPEVQQAITAVLQDIPNITPAKHDGKEVTVYGFVTVVRITNRN